MFTIIKAIMAHRNKWKHKPLHYFLTITKGNRLLSSMCENSTLEFKLLQFHS